MENCNAKLLQPSIEEQLKCYEEELKSAKQHISKLHNENIVLRRLFNQEYDMHMKFEEISQTSEEVCKNMHSVLYSIRNLLLSNDCKSRLTKNDKETIIKLLGRVNIYYNQDI